MLINDALKNEIAQSVKKSLAEDIGDGDITASLNNDLSHAKAEIVCREKMVLCGRLWVDEIYNQLDPNFDIKWMFDDGDFIEKNTIIFEITGSTQNILSGERCALNFLQTLSATATITRQYVEQLKNLNCKVLDTRKTLPGLRLAQKYAVLCGGGTNHRIGLFDAILIKENHIISGGGIKNIIQKSKALHPKIPIEIEVETLIEVKEAIKAGADRLLLDNFSQEMLEKAYEINQSLNDRPKLLEASGDITLNNIRKIAETGVDFISVGALTKHISAIDLSMRFTK
ncbi:MAG: carboxylating nicotinate-nucleotide diphosphorylase [Woeseiaceae bacterium]|mgnify:FL=1|jgi:nicotinate-nucleotide pyrophosphorylase (carboxylating)|nr:carboxylating nicotinate-nucleotide diphosphorylase [Woeseiaceae bacterium]|tara:strand:+ start:2496 stop:3350 length:855 start_codon:yes stop_codon:yes gene_type:complete